MSIEGRILLVEDEADLLDSLTLYLSERGHRVFPAADLATARHHLDTRPIDVAVLDVGAHGLRLAREAATRNIPCVLMSGRPVILEMGGLGTVLPKPFKLDVLAARIEELLRTYRDAPKVANRRAGKSDFIGAPIATRPKSRTGAPARAISSARPEPRARPRAKPPSS
jgi:DNA-binding response OmpR family regulator